LTASYPVDASTWEARSKDHKRSSHASITSYAIGIRHRKSGKALLERRVFSNTGYTQAHPSSSVSVDSGFVLVGGGAKNNWSGSGNLLTSFYPETENTWRADGKEHQGSSPSNITAYAIGLKFKEVPEQDTPEAHTIAPTPQTNIKVLTHNVFLLSGALGLYQVPGLKERANHIRAASYIKEYDVVILNELFEFNKGNKSAKLLLNGLSSEYPYQTPVIGENAPKTSNCSDRGCWNQTASDIPQGRVIDQLHLNGGVAIISKWPIEEKIQYIFKEEGCGADSYANKGFAYTKINKNGITFHIVATHTQAVDNGCGGTKDRDVRKNQFKEIREWIDKKSLPLNQEILLIGGDLNVDKSNNTEYRLMLKTLNVAEPVYKGHTATWDPETNDLAAFDHGDDSPEHLDYLFVEKSHPHGPNFINLVMTPSLPFPQTWRAKYVRGKKETSFSRESDEYSDHYPVAGYFNTTTHPPVFKKRIPRYQNVVFKSKSSKRYVSRSNSTDGWLIANQSQSNGKTRFQLKNWGETLTWVDPYCLTVNNYDLFDGWPGAYIQIKALTSDYYWNWCLGICEGANYGYHTKKNDSSDKLYLTKVNLTSGCLKNGDIVAFGDLGTFGKWYYIKVWPTGSWKDYLFLWDREHTDPTNRFVVEGIRE